MSRRQRKRRRQGTPLEKPQGRPAKTHAWTLPTVLGLILTALGALTVVELRPQLSVSPLEELASAQPFSAPFQITNAGYLGLHVENVIVVFHLVRAGSGVTFENAASGNKAWDNFDLGHGESKTILAYFENGSPQEADIVFAVDYTFLGRERRYFSRFQGIHMQRWEWTKQPIGNLRSSLNRIVDRALRLHYQADHPAFAN